VVPTNIRVIYGDTDRMGVVYYANYLRFFEAGRNEYLRAAGARYRDVEAEYGIMFPVVEANVVYRHPARYDDLVRVETSIAELKRASLRFTYRIVRSGDEKLLAEGHTVHACIDREHKPTRLPEPVAALRRADNLPG
jgi:acyl-CoA thioester hydrolase